MFFDFGDLTNVHSGDSIVVIRERLMLTGFIDLWQFVFVLFRNCSEFPNLQTMGFAFTNREGLFEIRHSAATPAVMVSSVNSLGARVARSLHKAFNSRRSWRFFRVPDLPSG